MSTLELEIRVKKLESDVDLLKNREVEPAWWRKVAGSFSNDKAHDEAMKLGRDYRTSQKTEDPATGNDNS